MKNNLVLPYFLRIAFEAPDVGTPSPTPAPVEEPVAEPTGEPTPAPAPAPVAEPAPAPAPEPITYEGLALPDGFEIPEAGREGFLSIVNNAELSRTDMLNQLIALQATATGDPTAHLADAMAAQFAQTQTEWREALTALPNFGGNALDQNLAEVKQGLELAGASAEAFAALDLTGAGNHPALAPLLHKLIKPYLEAAPVTTDPNQGKLTREQTMYPNMK